MKHSLAALAVAAALVPAAAGAADLAPAPYVPAPAPSDDLIITVTGNAQIGPKYPGAKDWVVYGYPEISWRRASEPVRFSAPDDGISIAVYENPWFRIGGVARIETGRYYGDDRRHLFGLRDVRWTVEPGLFVELWPVDYLRFRGEVRHGIREHDGFVGNLGIDYVARLNPFTFSIGPRLALGDDAWTQRWFGISPAESALNGVLPAFRARGGVSSVGGLASLRYDWSPQWSTTVYGGYNYLVGDAGRSPISRIAGSRDQFVAGASLSYSFVWK